MECLPPDNTSLYINELFTQFFLIIAYADLYIYTSMPAFSGH